jgi:hypothetical protein
VITADGRIAAGAMPVTQLSAWLDAGLATDRAAARPEARP